MIAVLLNRSNGEGLKERTRDNVRAIFRGIRRLNDKSLHLAVIMIIAN